ncbi:MAG: SDR family oxidoreductase [Gemmatimonadetes bacterium]|jgi:NAD(P)-dependent dehydrogenase (short-subunit alcohol dehydrogenase family)|nr:SDR family oxidoreductase [Gemmatimonadota bacterium]
MSEDTRSSLDLFGLKDRVALVTGGSKGLGESMALGLAQAGATTVICSRDQDACDKTAADIASQTGRESVGMSVDVTDEARVDQLFAAVAERFGRLDVLINSAGINARFMIDECPLEEFRKVLDINLTGTWLCCRAAMKIMKEQQSGSMINIGSALSAVGIPARTPYCSSKAGIIGLTQTLGLEGAPHNVRCNAVCPGPFLTELNRPLLKEPEKVQTILSKTALNRWAEMHEIRGVALFLASDASSYVTGGSIYVDGGWTAQ